MKQKRPSLQTIANHLGITKMTISRYLRNPLSVAEKNRVRIAQAIEEFGYIPNRVPEILSNARSKAIGILVPSLTNQVFAEVIKGIESITDQAGYQTMLAHYSYNLQKEEQRIESLLSYNIDGLILSEQQHTARTLKMLKVANIPIIEIMDSSENNLQQSIGFNNIEAAQAMTESIIRKGHKNIIYFSARMDQRTQLKMCGYDQAMQKFKLKPLHLITEEASSFTLGAQQLQFTLENYPETNGIFCTNDDLAIGALFECQRLGISVPKQISIAGFHGLDVGQCLTPQLATVITPRFEIGKCAAQELLDRLNNIPQQRNIIDLGYQIHLGQSI